MPDGGASVGDVLTRYLERIERIQEEKRELAAQEREVFAQAKNAGFDPKVMRAILKERRMDPGDREEWQALLDTYRAALGIWADPREAMRRLSALSWPPQRG